MAKICQTELPGKNMLKISYKNTLKMYKNCPAIAKLSETFT